MTTEVFCHEYDVRIHQSEYGHKWPFVWRESKRMVDCFLATSEIIKALKSLPKIIGVDMPELFRPPGDTPRRTYDILGRQSVIADSGVILFSLVGSDETIKWARRVGLRQDGDVYRSEDGRFEVRGELAGWMTQHQFPIWGERPIPEWGKPDEYLTDPLAEHTLRSKYRVHYRASSLQ